MTPDAMQEMAIHSLIRMGYTKDDAIRMAAFTSQRKYTQPSSSGSIYLGGWNDDDVPYAWMFCAYCGSELDKDQKKCPNCGAPRRRL